ncbi:MAG TPA: GAP family protein [Mycobacteriales bacterium]|jgi:cytochrome c biogenesis protein CcdA|nr:GAP family protein [Mycobacteriales bacterium]
MSAALALGLLGLAVLDAANPGTILACLLLLLTPSPLARTAAFVAGTYAAYAGGGLLVYLGLDAVLRPLLDRPAVRVGALAALAVALVLAGVHLWRTPPSGRGTVLPERWLRPGPAAVFGVLWTASDLPTALPLLVAVERLSAAGTPLPLVVVALAGYTLVYVAPLLLLLGLAARPGERARVALDRLRARLARPRRQRGRGRRLLAGLLVAAGALVAGWAAAGA